MKSSFKATRQRHNPVYRWSAAEEMSLVKFLMQNREFEKPVSQMYYTRFMEKNKIRLDWKLVRQKVRNMTAKYKNAKAWIAETGVENVEEETVKSTLIKMCTYFYEFDDIFGNREGGTDFEEKSFCSRVDIKPVVKVKSPAISEDSDSDEDQANAEDTVSAEGSVYAVDAEGTICADDLVSAEESMSAEEDTFSYDRPVSALNIVGEESIVEGERLTDTGLKGIHTAKTAVSDIMKVQSAMIILKKQKLHQDYTAREKEISIKERELKLKEKELEVKQKQFLSQMRMKEKEIVSQERKKEREIQSQEKLKILELEMKERLAKEELKLKYRYEM